MKFFRSLIYLACALAICSSCIKNGEDESPEAQQIHTLNYVNKFAFNVMSVYYLWVDEIQDGLKSWMSDDDPKAKVKEVRYKDPTGKDIDRWTQVTDDYESFVKSIEGVSTTYGYEFTLYYANADRTYVEVCVTVVYAGSPAEKAGLARGDLISKVDGSPIPTTEYSDIVKNKIMYSSHCKLGLEDGRELEMDAVEMYCDPMHTARVFDCGGKKVGYLHYTSFTLASCPDIIKTFEAFKAQGISELILDLRYNGGGYVQVEEVFASMIAPAAKVASGDVFMTEVYNQTLTDAWGDEEKNTHFRNKFKINGVSYDTSESNLGLTKVYAIMASGSASAAEALICGLKPFTDLTIVGEQTYGKYCTGIVLEGADWYESYKKQLSSSDYKGGVKYAKNWGIYVMIGRYADRDGNTPCMPDGFIPDIEVYDNPLDGYQLGDPNETMLKTVLTLAGYEYPAEPASLKKKPATIKGPASPKRETFGVFLRQ